MTINNVVSMLRMMFLRNGYWKLLSLVIAVLIYFSIRSEISHVRVLTIPVETDFETTAGGAVIESVEPRAVQVTLRGSYSELSQLAVPAVRCVVRPRQKKNALLDTVEVKIGHSSLRGVRGLRVAKIEPGTVVVKFDVPMSLMLAVAPPVLEGKARGRVELVYDQTNAVVKGSRRLLSPLDPSTARIQAESISVDGRSQTFATRVRLIPPGDAGSAIVEPSDMVVNVMILSEQATTRIERVPVFVNQPFSSSSRWKVDPEWVDVELTGRSEVVKAVTFAEVMASVDGTAPLASGSVTNDVPVIVHVQHGLPIDDVKSLPASVKLISLMPVTPQGGDAH